MGIYTSPRTAEIPDVDLLTLCFDPKYSDATDDAILHALASRPSVSLNKAGLRRLLEEFAFGLRTRFSIGASGRNKDVVLVFSSGQPAYPAIFLGIIAAGGVASLASPSGTAFELARQVRQGAAKVVVCSEELVDTAREALKQVEEQVPLLVLRSEPDWSLRIDGAGPEGELRSESADDRLTWERITDPKELRESLIALLYSSGTTGVPKGVMLSHDNFVAQAAVTYLPARAAIAEQKAAGVKFPPRRGLAHLPAAHIAGVTGYLVGPTYGGSTVFWMRKYRWEDFKRFSKELRITSLYTVPSIFLRIAKDPTVTDEFKTLQYTAGGAAPLDGALEAAANKRMGSAETKMSQVYGLSETCGALTAVGAENAAEDGSIGAPVPGAELRIVDEQDKDVVPGVPGELVCRGRIVTRGYFRNPEATAAAYRNGWFCTGDVAVERDGKLYIVDRIKELIKYKGLQIAPAEIEGLLDSHPAVLEAAVVGVPDPSEGATEGKASSSEIPRAYVVRRPGSQLSKQQVEDFVRERLAPYKQLRGGVTFVEELPKNALNKLLRRELKERAAKEFRSEMGARL